MSQGKILVEFKTANGGVIEVSEQQFLQSQEWLENINKQIQSHIGVPDATQEIEKEDEIMHEPDDQDFDMAEIVERQSSLSPIYETENMYPDESPSPMVIIRNASKFKPFTPPTISDEARQKMIAQRNSDRKRKADDNDDESILSPSSPFEPPLIITPEMRERARRNREAALAKRRSLQNLNN